MASPTKTFLQAVQTATLLIEVSAGVKAFHTVMICPNANDILQRIQAPGVRFPCVVLVDEGGDAHPHNRRIENNRFSATIAVANLRDGQAEWATEHCLDLCELFQQGDGTNPGQRKDFGTGTPIRSLAGTQTAPVGVFGHNEIIYKTMYFDYVLQRAA